MPVPPTATPDTCAALFHVNPAVLVVLNLFFLEINVCLHTHFQSLKVGHNTGV